MLQAEKFYPNQLISAIKEELLISTTHQKLRVDTVGQVYYFPVNDIIRIQSFSNYSKIFFKKDKPMLVAKVLRKFEEQLIHADFIRIHRSHLINKQYLHSYVPIGTGVKVFLLNGDQIPLARRRKTILTLIDGLS
jgi:two-component system, LytTR family, response regulator